MKRVILDGIGFDANWLESFASASELADSDTMKAHYEDEAVRLAKATELIGEKLPEVESTKPTKKQRPQ